MIISPISYSSHKKSINIRTNNKNNNPVIKNQVAFKGLNATATTNSFINKILLKKFLAAIGLLGLSGNILSHFLNKNIKFDNLEQAREYGKTIILKALNNKNPYEHLVIIDKDTNAIIAQVKGEKDNIKTDAFNLINPSRNFSVEHGHPTSCIINGKPASMPISFTDYRSGIWGHNAEEVIAYDANGNFSKLRRSANYKKLSDKEIVYYEKLQMQIYDEIYLKKMLEHLPKEFHSVTSGIHLKRFYDILKINGQLSKELDIKFQKAFNETKKECPELLYGIDKFWNTHAEKLGVIYESNYEYLKTPPIESFSDFLNTLNLEMIFRLYYNLKNENKKIIEEAIRKKDFETIRKICNKKVQATTLTENITREDFIKYMSTKFTKVDKIDVKLLNDSEIRNLAKLLGTTEEQIRQMDKKEFRRLCIQTHPDKNPNDNMANEIFIILSKIFSKQ